MSATVTDLNPKQQFLEQFELPSEGLDFDRHQASLREEARSVLNEIDFPNTRQEYWKYTRTAPILRNEYRQVVPEIATDFNPEPLGDQETIDLVFVNGYYMASHSDTAQADGLTVLPLQEAKEKFAAIFQSHFGQLINAREHAFTAMNAAFHINGCFIHVRANTIVDLPIRILNYTQGNQVGASPRHLFIAEKGSQVKVIQSYEASTGELAFTNTATEIFVAENAHVEYVQLQNKNDSNYHIETTEVVQERNSRFEISTVTLKGLLVRNNLNIVVDGEGCETNLNGLYLSKGKQHVDNHTLVDHREPHCNSNELYKGIMNEQSTGVFNGKVYVRQKAQKTNAFQSNQNVLLSDEATINSKPELEIYADDVKCSHGSTTGQMDEEALFYLRSRGIGESAARKLMIQAFASEVLDGISIDALRDVIEDFITARYESVFGS